MGVRELNGPRGPLPTPQSSACGHFLRSLVPRRVNLGGKFMRWLSRAVLATLLAVQLGCGALQKPSWNKPWGRGTWIPALVCGAVGAGVGVAIQSQRPGTTKVIYPDGTVQESSDPQDLWKGAVIGLPVGAAVCALLGHVFLDKPTPELPPAPIIETPTPTPTPAPVERKRIVLRGVNFDFNSSEIKPEFDPVLDEAVLILNDYPDLQVLISGHTDSIGSEQYNEALSIRRAESVFRYLVNKGLNPERFRIEGFGELHPVADNNTEAGRAQNRRVELKVLE